jgi:uncharacterized small protein (DUF1192 family)
MGIEAMAVDDESVFGAPPRKTASHQIGENLDDLSVHQIEERILLLSAEIERLDEARKAKQASLGAAAAFFKI